MAVYGAGPYGAGAYGVGASGDLTGTATITATSAVTAAPPTLAQNGTVTVTSTSDVSAVAPTLAQSGSLTVTATSAVLFHATTSDINTAVMAATSAMSAGVPNLSQDASITIVATSDVGATPTLDLSGAATIVATTNITADGLVSAIASVTIGATSAMTAQAPVLVQQASAAMIAISAVTAHGTIVTSATGSVVITATSDMSAAAALAFSASATIAATSDVTTRGFISQPPPADSTHYRNILIPGYRRPTLTGGITSVRTRVFLSDLHNRRGDEITHLLSSDPGDITVDADRRIAGTIRLDTKSPLSLPAWSWVAVHVEVTRESQPTTTRQAGLFRMLQPASDGRAGHSPTTINGEDVTVLMHNHRIGFTWNIGTMLTGQTLMQGVMYETGIPRSRIPPTTRTMGYDRSLGIGTTSWKLATFIAGVVGWRVPWATHDGVITTGDLPDPRAPVQPAHVFSLGHDARVLGDVQTSRSDATFANQIIAISENPTRPRLITTVQNDDPSDPFSTTYPGGPGIVSDEHRDNSIDDELVLELVSLAELITRGVQADVTVQLPPDVDINLHDVIQLAASPDMAHLDHAAGIWSVRGMQRQLRTGLITVRARKTEYSNQYKRVIA